LFVNFGFKHRFMKDFKWKYGALIEWASSPCGANLLVIKIRYQLCLAREERQKKQEKIQLNSLVQIFNSTKRLQSVSKYFLGCSCLSIVSKRRGAKLNHTEKLKQQNFQQGCYSMTLSRQHRRLKQCTTLFATLQNISNITKKKWSSLCHLQILKFERGNQSPTLSSPVWISLFQNFLYIYHHQFEFHSSETFFILYICGQRMIQHHYKLYHALS
jgi:hypothetical protein